MVGKSLHSYKYSVAFIHCLLGSFSRCIERDVKSKPEGPLNQAISLKSHVMTPPLIRDSHNAPGNARERVFLTISWYITGILSFIVSLSYYKSQISSSEWLNIVI